MRRALLIAAAVSAAAPFAAAAGEAERHRIAVLDVRAVQGVAPGTATILTNIVVDDTARGGWDVISQADVAALLGFERQRRMLGCGEDSSCLAEIGGALGVEFVLTAVWTDAGARTVTEYRASDGAVFRLAGPTTAQPWGVCLGPWSGYASWSDAGDHVVRGEYR